MSNLSTHTIHTMQDFVSVVEALRTGVPEPHWYRGISKSSYQLLPSLYRHPTTRSSDELIKLERKLIIRFKERSLPFLSTTVKGMSDWEYLFLMQHFGAPTRLLDWTENPFIALFFALSGAMVASGGMFVDDVAVWLFSPGKWNKKVFSYVSFKGDILSYTDSQAKSYDPDVEKKFDPPDYPAAIFGVHNSPRIVAQRGVFTIFGSNTLPMEEIFEKESFPDTTLQKIIIPAPEGLLLFESLIALGYTDTVLFPDLEGLARETKRFFGF